MVYRKSFVMKWASYRSYRKMKSTPTKPQKEQAKRYIVAQMDEINSEFSVRKRFSTLLLMNSLSQRGRFYQWVHRATAHMHRVIISTLPAQRTHTPAGYSSTRRPLCGRTYASKSPTLSTISGYYRGVLWCPV